MSQDGQGEGSKTEGRTCEFLLSELLYPDVVHANNVRKGLIKAAPNIVVGHDKDVLAISRHEKDLLI